MLRDGLCRFDAPIRSGTDTLWPLTKESDWCGQWKPALVPEHTTPPYGRDET